MVPEQGPARTPQHASEVHDPRRQPATVLMRDPAQAPAAGSTPSVPVAEPAAPAATPSTSETPVAVAAPPAAVPGSINLSLTIITRVDVGRLVRELEKLNDYFKQAAIKGSQTGSLPRVSILLEQVARENDLNLIHGDQRDNLLKYLTNIKDTAPVVHVSFPSDPSAEFLQKLLSWFRTEAHPHALLHVGLQPELAAGCIIRTTNKYFDLSFRKHFKDSKPKLVAALGGKE